MLFDRREKSYHTFSLFTITSYLKFLTYGVSEKLRVNSEKIKIPHRRGDGVLLASPTGGADKKSRSFDLFTLGCSLAPPRGTARGGATQWHGGVGGRTRRLQVKETELK